jgi:hypothetical protein
MPFPQFDRTRLRLKSLDERVHDLDRSELLYPGMPREPFEHPALSVLAQRLREAREGGGIAIAFCGAHVLRRGLAPLLIDLMGRGYLHHVALNGAGAIHDFELALIGATTESVARYIREGRFGLWEETGRLNEVAKTAQAENIGFGEALGRVIQEEEFPFRQTSVLAAGYRLQVPVTVHVSIGQDIIHEHPNCDGAALGAASYSDFLVFAYSVSRLEGGVFLNLGTAVTGPEVYLKALAMARNVAHTENRRIRHFTTAVFDLVDLGVDWREEAPKNDARYYFRPYKTILVRTVADGGESYYIRGDHRATVPALYDALMAGDSARD